LYDNKKDILDALNLIFDGVINDRETVFVYRKKEGLEFYGNPREMLMRFTIYIMTVMEINYKKKFTFDSLLKLGLKVLYEEKIYKKDFMNEIKKK